MIPGAKLSWIHHGVSVPEWESPHGIFLVRISADAAQNQILEELAAHRTDLSVAGSAASRKEIANLLQHLVRADRYERRALSRRKFLIRSFSEITPAHGDQPN
jgi:hypothetical protein